MPKGKIPDRLKVEPVEVEDPQVPIDMTAQRTYEPEQINNLQNLGLIKLDGERFRSISEIGKSAKSLGLIHLMHGGYMVSVDSLLQAIGMAGQIVAGVPGDDGQAPTREEKIEAGKLIGYLADKLAKVNGGVTKVEQARAEVAIAVDKQRRQSFQPGMVISAESGKTVKTA